MGPGIVLVHALWTPRTFLLLLCQPFYISRVSLFLFFLFFLRYSSVAQTLKNVGPLDCNLRLLRRRSLGGKISVAEVIHLLTLNVSANFRVVLVVVAFFIFFFFIHFLSYFLFLSFSLWWLRTFFFWVEIVSESTLIETSFARQSISLLPSRPRVSAPWVRELEFSVPKVFKAIEDGSTAPRPAWCPWKTKT